MGHRPRKYGDRGVRFVLAGEIGKCVDRNVNLAPRRWKRFQFVRYRGDSIRILTQNQWLRYAYECAFDPVARKIVSVELRPGRLVPPAAVAQAAGALVGQPVPKPPAPAAPQAGQPQPKAQAAPQAGQPQPNAQAGQPQPAAAKPKPRPHFGEPSPVSITQAHLHGGQVDTLTRIYQIPLGGS